MSQRTIFLVDYYAQEAFFELCSVRPINSCMLCWLLLCAACEVGIYGRPYYTPHLRLRKQGVYTHVQAPAHFHDVCVAVNGYLSQLRASCGAAAADEISHLATV